MSVIMTLKAKGNPEKLEQIASENPDRLRGIADRAKEHGAIAHRFYGSDDGSVMVVDEWPDAESFQRFFEAEQGDIQPLMEEAEMTGEPEVTFWRKLETNDDIGWEG
jgi:heme-degrading monooxygenase HmoA